MDAYFVQNSTLNHPYPIKVWAIGADINRPFVLTYDGVKIRLFNFLTKEVLAEKDYLNHELISVPKSINVSSFSINPLFLIIKNRRMITAFDETLNQIPTLTFDTNLIIVEIVWSESKSILYTCGQFGWIRAFSFQIKVSISGTTATWVPGWSWHKKKRWIDHIAIDEINGVLYCSSGTRIYVRTLDKCLPVFKYETHHTMPITRIVYSSNRLLLFTASSDGTIKAWRLYNKHHELVYTISQMQLGKTLIDIDNMSILSVSHERVLRRYNITTGNIIGTLDLDPSVSPEKKNVQADIGLNVAFCDGREWAMYCEGNSISVFNVLYAPRELAVCCDVVIDIIVDYNNNIFAYCKNNVIHLLHPDSSDGKLFDLDTMIVDRLKASHYIFASETSLVLHGSKLFVSYMSGDIKVLNISSNILTETYEPMKDSPLKRFSKTHNVLGGCHQYCNVNDSANHFLIGSSKGGVFTLHCMACNQFIGAWRITNTDLIQILQVPEKTYVICLEASQVSLWKCDDQSFDNVFTYEFDEYDNGQQMVFVNNDTIVVALQNGKCNVFHVSTTDPQCLQYMYAMKLHESDISRLLPCMMILDLDGGKEIFQKYDLKDLMCSIGSNDTLTISDCSTGLIQYQTTIPSHINSHSASYVIQGKIMIVLSIDQNMRLLDWPKFTRIVPFIPHTIQQDTSTPQDSKESGFDVVLEEDDSKNDYIVSSPGKSIIQQAEELFSLNRSPQIVREMSPKQQIRIMSPSKENKSNGSIGYVFENGWPRIVITKDNELQEIIIDENQDVVIGDILKTCPRSSDEVMEKNRQIIERLINSDEKFKQAFQTQKVKSVKRVDHAEINEAFFYENFLSINIKRIESPKKRKPTTPIQPSTPLVLNEKPSYVSPTPIKPIGIKKKRQPKQQRKFIIIEFDDGTKMKTDEETAELLEKMVSNPNEPPTLTPGYIFQKALNDLGISKSIKDKKVLIQEQELLALPILTLMNGGMAVGANSRRFFPKKPFKKFVTEEMGSFVTASKNGKVVQTPFFHWEGVRLATHSKPGIIGMKSIIEETGDEEEEDHQYGRISHNGSILDQILQKHSKRKGKHIESIYEEDSFEENYNPNQFNLFDHNDELATKLMAASPSIKAVSNLLGTSNNPLLDLLSKMPQMSSEEIDKELNRGPRDSIGIFPANTLQLPDFNKSPLASIIQRPPSPRPIDAISELTKRMHLAQPFLPIIQEAYLDDSLVEDGETSSVSNLSSDSSFSISPRKMNMMRTQAAIQENLQRNDFQSLRSILDESGLLEDDYFIELPRWQPTVYFLTHHQKQLSGQNTDQGSQKEDDLEEESTENIDLSNNDANQKLDSQSSIESFDGTAQDSSREDNTANKDSTEQIYHNESEQLLSTPIEEEEMEEEIVETFEEEEIVDEQGNKSRVFKVSHGLTPKFTRKKIPIAKIKILPKAKPVTINQMDKNDLRNDTKIIKDLKTDSKTIKSIKTDSVSNNTNQERVEKEGIDSHKEKNHYAISEGLKLPKKDEKISHKSVEKSIPKSVEKPENNNAQASNNTQKIKHQREEHKRPSGPKIKDHKPKQKIVNNKTIVEKNDPNTVISSDEETSHEYIVDDEAPLDTIYDSDDNNAFLVKEEEDEYYYEEDIFDEEEQNINKNSNVRIHLDEYKPLRRERNRKTSLTSIIEQPSIVLDPIIPESTPLVKTLSKTAPTIDLDSAIPVSNDQDKSDNSEQEDLQTLYISGTLRSKVDPKVVRQRTIKRPRSNTTTKVEPVDIIPDSISDEKLEEESTEPQKKDEPIIKKSPQRVKRTRKRHQSLSEKMKIVEEKLRLKKEEEDELLAQLLAKTNSNQKPSLDIRFNKTEITVIQPPTPKLERPKALGQPILLKPEFEPATRKRLTRTKSLTLKPKTPFSKNILRLFDETDLNSAESILLTHFANTLFNSKTGEIRRNSFNKIV